MPANKLSLSKRLLWFLASFIVCAYLLSCLTSYINPSYGSLWTILALGFPVMLILMALLVAISLFISTRVFFISLLILLTGYKNINSCFAYHIFNASIYKGKTIKVLSWNVDDLLDVRHDTKQSKVKRKRVIDFIKDNNPDIVCLQDNSFCIDPHSIQRNDIITLEQLGYTYHILSDDFRKEQDKLVVYGTGIFSKYPIDKSNKVKYEGIYYESLLCADINVKGNRFSVYTTHLRSMHLRNEIFYSTEDYTMIQQDTADILGKSKLHKLIYFDKKHAEQAIIAKKVMDSSRLPFIFCGDLNSVPSSYVYHYISKGLNDVFLQKGWGFGNTYSEISPTIRIDVMLTSPQFTSLNYSCTKLALSDHYPIVATIGLPQNK